MLRQQKMCELLWCIVMSFVFLWVFIPSPNGAHHRAAAITQTDPCRHGDFLDLPSASMVRGTTPPMFVATPTHTTLSSAEGSLVWIGNQGLISVVHGTLIDWLPPCNRMIYQRRGSGASAANVMCSPMTLACKTLRLPTPTS